MTQEEKELFELLGECWNKFFALPELHKSDKCEFSAHIHALQNMVLGRMAYKQYLNEEHEK